MKLNDLDVILLEKEFHTQQCTQLVYYVPRFLEIIDRRCCVLSGSSCIVMMRHYGLPLKRAVGNRDDTEVDR